MQHTLKVASAAALIRNIVVTYGYRPVGSVVLIPVEGHVTGALLRFNLPSVIGPFGSRSAYDSAARTMAGLALRVAGTTGVVPVMLLATPLSRGLPGRPARGGALPYAGLASALGAVFDELGVESVSPVICGSDAWGVMTPRADGGFSITRRRLTELDDEVLSAPVCVEAARTAPLTAAEVQTFPTGGRASVLERWDALYRAADAAGVSRTGAAASDAELAPLVATVSAMFCTDAGRDAWLALTAFGTPHLEGAVEQCWSELLDRPTTPFDRPSALVARFEHGRCALGLRVLQRLYGLVAPEARVGVVTAIAWLGWALGRSTEASRWLGRLPEQFAEDPFVRLLAALLEEGVVPAWFGTVPHSRGSRAA